MGKEYSTIDKTINIPDSLIRIGFEQEFAKNEIMFSSNDTLDGIYIILKGRAVIYSFSLEGQDQIFMILDYGDIIGEAIVLGGLPGKVSCKALGDLKILYIHKIELIELLRTDFDADLFIYNSMSRKIRHLSNQVQEMAFKTSETRISNLFIELADRYGEKIGSSVSIDFNLTQQFISDVLGIKRITTSKIMQNFTNQKLIKKFEGRYVIKDLDRLKQYR